MTKTTKTSAAVPALVAMISTIGPDKFETFDFSENLLQTAIDSTFEETQELHKELMAYNMHRKVFISNEAKDAFKEFANNGSRMTAYDATQWKKIKAIVDFMDSDSNETDIHTFGEIITIISQSKFLTISSVLNVALPTNDAFEPLALIDSRQHQLVRIVADIVSKKDQEITSNMKYSADDWKNAMLIARSVMKFPLEAVDSI